MWLLSFVVVCCLPFVVELCVVGLFVFLFVCLFVCLFVFGSSRTKRRVSERNSPTVNGAINAFCFTPVTWVGLGGWVGWGVMTSLKLHTCRMLLNTWGWGGWVGCNDILEVAHMLDAT